MKTIICTTGTSIAKGCANLASLLQRTTRWDEEDPLFRQQVRERIDGFDLTEPQNRISASAEMNSLERIGMSADDRVVLLASDTCEGRITAEELRQAIPLAFGLEQEAVNVRRIEGLQVRDGPRFREQGILSLTKAILDHVENPQLRFGGEIVLNPTGGYKGVVPFVCILGMLFRLKTFYVFEHSTTLIRLPPMPISFDLQIYNRAAAAIERVYRNSYINEQEFYRLIEGFQETERDLFSSLVEVEDAQVTLSPLALVLAEIDRGGARNIMLERHVQQQLTNATAEERVIIERLLVKLSSPLWRAIHRHSFSGTDLAVFKPGNVPERAACILDGSRVNVCRLFLRHDEYERSLPGLRSQHFDTTTFMPWEPPRPADQTPEEYDEVLRQRIEELKEELQHLRQTTVSRDTYEKRQQETRHVKNQLSNEQRRRKDAEAQNDSQREEIRKVHNQLANEQRRRKDAEAQIESLREEIRTLEQRLAQLQGGQP